MIEIIIRNYLAEELDVDIVFERPKNPPTEYILLQKIDGGRVNQIDAATLSVQVISDSLYGAALLRDSVTDALFNSITLDAVSHVGIGGETSGTDSANHNYYYDLTFNFYYYEGRS